MPTVELCQTNEIMPKHVPCFIYNNNHLRHQIQQTHTNLGTPEFVLGTPPKKPTWAVPQQHLHTLHTSHHGPAINCRIGTLLNAIGASAMLWPTCSWGWGWGDCGPQA